MYLSVNAAPATVPVTLQPVMTSAIPLQTEPIVDSVSRRRRTSQFLLGMSKKRHRRLYCYGTGRNLQIWPDGTVNGTTGDVPYTILQFISLLNVAGLVGIKGVESGNYLCMNASGAVYGSPKKTDECEFRETIGRTYYNSYSSKKYKGKRGRPWYLALDRKGRTRPGNRTKYNKNSMFLPREITPPPTLPFLSIESLLPMRKPPARNTPVNAVVPVKIVPSATQKNKVTKIRHNKPGHKKRSHGGKRNRRKKCARKNKGRRCRHRSNRKHKRNRPNRKHRSKKRHRSRKRKRQHSGSSGSKKSSSS